jgi:hypothetical protein
VAFFCSVDTMKESKDVDTLTQAQINDDVYLTATLNVTHITCCTPYDFASNNPNIQAQWASAIRAAGKSVWWRCHWNQWENDYGTTGIMTPATYISDLSTWLSTYGTILLAAGDIFDPCPEPENGLYWFSQYGAGGSGTNGTSIAAYNSFITTLRSTVQSWLSSNGYVINGPTGVETRIQSVSSFQAYTPAVLAAASLDTYVTFDIYPDAGIETASGAVAALLSQIAQIAYARPGLQLVMGEHGWDNDGGYGNNQATQNAILMAEFNALLSSYRFAGFNYWPGAPDIGSTGFCELFTGTTGAWTLRTAAGAVAAYFAAMRQTIPASAVIAGSGEALGTGSGLVLT